MGVQVGDFDANGKSDLAYRGYCGATRPCFRVQLSEGDMFSAGKNWGNGAYFSADSVHLGLVVGDIDHDGRDDIGYRGYCGEKQARWRYHRSTGQGFEVVCAEARRH